MKTEEISWEAELDLDAVNFSVNQALNTKKLFRYQFKESNSLVNILENEVCKYVQSDFALGVSSATNAIFLALKAVGVKSNSKVLIPAFTFTAVPSAVLQCGAEPILVDINDNYVIDLKDLELKIISTEAKYLLLSHMRGHLCDMDKVVSICRKYSIILIEDAAHALGVKWKGKHAGTFGVAGVYSLQSYKLINAGEGGVLVTNDPEVFWKSVFMSGSYEKNYLLHSSNQTDIAEKYINQLPIFNVRMNNLTAAIAIPQIHNIESTIDKINENYIRFSEILDSNKIICFPQESSLIRAVRDSAQIRIKLNESLRLKLKSELNNSNIPISYFGGKNNTNARLYENWKFLDISNAVLPNTKRNLEEVFDLRLPTHFTITTIENIARVFLKVLKKVESNS
ncbi:MULTISPECIES: DegT/DnrJ/EryC1/StrS family aminotransferase [Prochlorococcus]|uniref:DegT/DnrJ/EryC1/StrS aminotransferase family enzyme n=1 Tax=Prochlorococcus marinus (strain SARG / CCMP1375 / SS120) TaxID=167539 RepID=Q7VAK6_PROMA|nr:MULTISPECIES: aminotransferase class I/II-fold pyridoxal phosphate-dependent enzyme [Prochlorococcus]AAQ00500.1 DegT/DnrJ/EryC1/StrS aminotransferase family enzyme [Prochlorococcus marinus subsp. marinus str. CCMP1375]KGG14387.1 DegT/DnrJ/EryC1/StrS aminotransferase family enzyme [Prochlorococcus marinus str. LG]KGG22039.1 DegT/DnrJ/EryC1/StrS aminotransferase family enzyme [Prochlorococcus marinus str. SS2]KGG24643.1 DegT/DnrJ/EryC1/StrS aminotransferase family enzyme [Prochlorococcus marin